MKLAKKLLRRASSKSNSGKLVYKAVVDYSDFNEVEFLEYDSTPYDGGCNLALAYGEPLPPSDAICYPRLAWDPNSKNLEEFSYGSVMAPYGQEPVHVDHEKPWNGGGLTQAYEEEKPSYDHEKPRNDSGLTESYEEERPSYDGNGNWPSNPVPCHGNDFWGGDIFSYGNGYGCNNYEEPMDPYQGEEERWGYGNGMAESQPGYNSQSNCTEPYENLFGGWLWSSRDDGDSYTRHDGVKPSNGNSWNGTADYIFGFSYPYGERRDENHSYGYPTHSYEKHSHEQPHHVLVEYREPSCTLAPSCYEAYQEEVHKHSHEQPHHVLVKYREPSWPPEPSYYQDYQEEVHKYNHEQPHHALVEYQEPSWTPEPSYYQAYQEEVHTQTEDVSLYERHSHEQPQYGHSEYSEPSWFQKPPYYEAYQEDGYPGPKYSDDSYRESGEEFYYHNHKYATYDDDPSH